MQNDKRLLCHVPDSELLTGTPLAELFKKAGYADSPKTVIGQKHWWNLAVCQVHAELQEEIQNEKGN